MTAFNVGDKVMVDGVGFIYGTIDHFCHYNRTVCVKFDNGKNYFRCWVEEKDLKQYSIDR